MTIRTACLVIAMARSVTTADAQGVSVQRLEELANAVEPKIIEWRRDIHSNPELGNREFRTAALVAGHLAELGLEVTEGVAHTGVVGVLRGSRPGPVVALRAGMDALPVTEEVDLPFSCFADEVPGLMMLLGVTPPGVAPATAAPNHSPAFYVDEAALVTGVQAMLGVTTAWLDGDASR